MSDYFKTVKSVLDQIDQKMEWINRLPRPSPSYLRMVEQARRTVENTQHLQATLDQATERNRIAERLSTVHQSWFKHLEDTQNDFHRSLKLALRNVSPQLIATERFITALDFDALGNRLQIEIPTMLNMENSIARVAASYENLTKSLNGISEITGLPDFILPGATRELYTTGFVFETLRPRDELDVQDAEEEIRLVSEAELETSDCISLLQKVAPELARPYIGARDSLNGNNADRARHILSSLRELWGHLLRHLAPDELVLAWVTEENANEQSLLYEGRPTRRARILYICRNLNKEPFTEFLINDTQMLVELIQLFNRVHKLDSGLTDEQLRAIFLKNDSWLMYILQIQLGNSSK